MSTRDNLVTCELFAARLLSKGLATHLVAFENVSAAEGNLLHRHRIELERIVLNQWSKKGLNLDQSTRVQRNVIAAAAVNPRVVEGRYLRTQFGLERTGPKNRLSLSWPWKPFNSR